MRRSWGGRGRRMGGWGGAWPRGRGRESASGIGDVLALCSFVVRRTHGVWGRRIEGLMVRGRRSEGRKGSLHAAAQQAMRNSFRRRREFFRALLAFVLIVGR